jgi:hypothetical protein
MRANETNKTARELKEWGEFFSELQKIAKADLTHKAQNSTVNISKTLNELKEPVGAYFAVIGVSFGVLLSIWLLVWVFKFPLIPYGS